MSHSVPLCVAKDRIDRSGIVTNSFLVGRWITKRGLITDAWWRGSQSSAVRSIRTQLLLRFHVTCPVAGRP